MKKLYILLMAAVVLATSCKKEEELSTTCYCVYYYNGGSEARLTYPMKGYYQDRECNKKQIELQRLYGYKNAKCSLY